LRAYKTPALTVKKNDFASYKKLITFGHGGVPLKFQLVRMLRWEVA
jgi:hypothetical protein